MQHHNGALLTVLTAVCLASFVEPARAQVQDMLPSKDAASARVNPKAFSPYVGRNFPVRVYWGDTHLHTQISVDAGTMTTMTQENAFRFARGEEVTATHGLRAKLSRPLDFLVIADHAEMYGLMPQLLGGDPKILATKTGRRWYDALTSDNKDTVFNTAMEIVGTLSADVPPIDADKAVRDAWRKNAQNWPIGSMSRAVLPP
jgi:hypothetical protein